MQALPLACWIAVEVQAFSSFQGRPGAETAVLPSSHLPFLLFVSTHLLTFILLCRPARGGNSLFSRRSLCKGGRGKAGWFGVRHMGLAEYKCCRKEKSVSEVCCICELDPICRIYKYLKDMVSLSTTLYNLKVPHIKMQN